MAVLSFRRDGTKQLDGSKISESPLSNKPLNAQSTLRRLGRMVRFIKAINRAWRGGMQRLRLLFSSSEKKGEQASRSEHGRGWWSRLFRRGEVQELPEIMYADQGAKNILHAMETRFAGVAGKQPVVQLNSVGTQSSGSVESFQGSTLTQRTVRSNSISSLDEASAATEIAAITASISSTRRPSGLSQSGESTPGTLVDSPVLVSATPILMTNMTTAEVDTSDYALEQEGPLSSPTSFPLITFSTGSPKRESPAVLPGSGFVSLVSSAKCSIPRATSAECLASEKEMVPLPRAASTPSVVPEREVFASFIRYFRNIFSTNSSTVLLRSQRATSTRPRADSVPCAENTNVDSSSAIAARAAFLAVLPEIEAKLSPDCNKDHLMRSLKFLTEPGEDLLWLSYAGLSDDDLHMLSHYLHSTGIGAVVKIIQVNHNPRVTEVPADFFKCFPHLQMVQFASTALRTLPEGAFAHNSQLTHLLTHGSLDFVFPSADIFGDNRNHLVLGFGTNTGAQLPQWLCERSNTSRHVDVFDPHLSDVRIPDEILSCVNHTEIQYFLACRRRNPGTYVREGCCGSLYSSVGTMPFYNSRGEQEGCDTPAAEAPADLSMVS